MIVRRHAGLVEMIASPQERQRDLVSDNVLVLLANIDARLRALETRMNLPTEKGDEFAAKSAQILEEIERTRETYQQMLEAGERPVATPLPAPPAP